MSEVRERMKETGEARSRWNRREFLALGTGALLVATLPRAFGGRRRPLVRRTVPAMGSFAEIAVPAEDGQWARAAIDAALDEIRKVEARLTRFRADSDVGRANRAAPGAAVPVDPVTADALEAALAWARRSEGRFDPCLARAVALWDVNGRSSPPSAVETRRFADRALWRALEIDRSAGRSEIRLHDPDAGIDLGGIGKGIGVDRAVAVLRRHGVEDALVNLGGDLYALGR
ncbi:MAG: FAD:protein FMN transferase, partial [Gemmatimonadota bacterium]|nr:FAD:protein FMN transferase [Gemmatimonadota bacterium]